MIRLIAKTEADPSLVQTPDQFIGYVARVSNPANQSNHDTAEKLLRFLRDHQHWSPFEMAHAVMEINTTRDIARQILRHRSFSFQEFSQRYSDAIEFSEPREARLQDAKNRQNSIPPTGGDFGFWERWQRDVIEIATVAYKRALEAGIAKEVARAVLPEGLTMSRLYMAGSIRSWIHYIELRTRPETQKEHRLVAEACREELAKAFPSVFGEMGGGK